MNFDLYVIAVTERGVQCALDGDNSPAFWLPRQQVEWRGILEPGEQVRATIPRWVVQKHKQLVAVRGQFALPLHQTGLDPDKAQGPIPMADQSNELRGVLFRETSPKSEKSPHMTGHLTIGGIRYRLAGWTKEGKDGRKYLSILAEPPKDQRADEQSGNSYARATGRDDRAQQKPAGGPSFDGREEIPF